jgi:ADP-heptose:LPS heptosyltransferase
VTTVLALRALGLGDALTGIPALRGLRRAHPDAHLVLAAPAGLGGWLRDLGVVDEVLPTTGLAELPSTRRPDLAVNLHGCGPRSHELLLRLHPRDLLAYACPLAGWMRGPVWDESEHEVHRWCRLVRGAGGACSPTDLLLPALVPGSGRHVVLHPGAAARSRRWPVDRWATVAAALADDGHEVVVTGVPTEAARCAAVAAGHPGVRDECGRHGLADLAILVASATLLLCGDTGVAHLATAARTPSVLLFGPTAPGRWGPALDEDRHRVLWHGRPGDPPGDPHADVVDARLARIDVDEVLAQAREVLERVSSQPARGS